MTEIAADDGIAIDVSEFLTKSGIHPELLFHEGAPAVDDGREETSRAELVEGTRPEPLDSARDRPLEGEPSEEFDSERFDIGFDGELSRTAQTSAEPFGGEPSTRAQAEGQPRTVEPLSRMPRPEPLDSARGTRVEGPSPEPVEGPVADVTEGQWEGERPPWIKPEVSLSPRPELVEGPPLPNPVERLVEGARPEPLDSARGKCVEGPAPKTPTPSVSVGRRPPVPAPPAASKMPPAAPAGEAPKPMTSTGKEPVPTGSPPSGPSLEGPFPEIEPSRITDEIMLNSPIAPWVLIMHLAADVVSRGVLLFVRKDGITGHDQFGVGGGRDSGDERIINIKIPWNQPSILAAAVHARTTYRGKISAGKWNDYFLNQLGGNKPDEAVIIPIIVAGKVVAIFYGDDAGSGTPLGDVERLQALIDQTFSAVEASILAKRSKPSA
jgi:hypothetical protein